jgi:hypothetical protein
MTYRKIVAVLCLGLTVPSACDEGMADDGEGVAVPIAVDCSFVFAGTQTDVTYEVTDGERTETAIGG